MATIYLKKTRFNETLIMQTKQRGSGWSIKLVFNLYKLFGYKFIYYLMYPVTFFYALISTNVKEALRDYYKHIGVPFNFWVYYEHLRIFAITMVDRFITKVDKESYTFLYDDKETPLQVFQNGTILLLSHFGGWAASASVSRSHNKLNIVMQEALLDSIKSIEDDINAVSNVNIIDLNQGTIRVSIEIANALMKDEIVAIMGDRASNDKATVGVNFFGQSANFNKNPFQIAYKMDKPIMVYFVIYKSIQTYKIEFIKIDMDKTKKEEQAIQKAIKTYVKFYENILQEHPNQWLNFYHFWQKKV